MNERIILSYGTYDLFHYGHVQILKRMRQMGDKLIIGCSSDAFNKAKGKKSFFNYEERAEILKSIRYVDEVFPEESWEQKVSDIKKYGAHLFVMGDDWKGKFDFIEKETTCSVMYLPRTVGVSTTNIKEALSTIKKEKIEVILEKLRDLEAGMKSL